MLLASVILDIPTQSLDTAFSYAVPDDIIDLEIGCAVLVPFGHRQAIGYVVGKEEISELGDQTQANRILDISRLKSIYRVLSRPYFNELGAECAKFLSDTYIAPLSSCVRLFTPPGGVPRIVRSKSLEDVGKGDGDGSYWRVEEPEIGPVDDRWVRLGKEADGFEPKKTAVKQKAIIEALKPGELRVAELSIEFGSVSSVLKNLASKGVIEIFTRRRMRGEEEGATLEGFIPSKKPVLTEGQEKALETIHRMQERSCGEVVVVDGVTGSGKTEVYLQAIEKTLEVGCGAIVLVPEISLTPQTVARFRGRFGDRVAVMHSRMGQGERYDQWDRIRAGSAQVVVGARSALFAPIENIGLIIIDEEHESSYKQDSAPRYVSRDVAAWMVKRHNATLVLGSATPSIEALYRCDNLDTWHRVELPARANGKPMPKIEVVDMAREFAGGHRSMFSRTLTQALFDTLDLGQKAVLLLNQRGFASFLLCRNCGYVPECISCSTSLTYHERGNLLMCHHCSYSETAPAICPKCGSPYLKKFGAGTQRVESELHGILESRDAKVIRMDADTTTKKGAHHKLLEEFETGGASVLLGTQMIAKGLDFEDVTLVGVINADTMLKLPDFRSSERTFDLIEQVAGRAGRADLPGRVIVQTYWSDAVAIRSAAEYNRTAFLQDEMPKRKALEYPPYAKLANVLVWGKDEGKVRETAGMIFEDLQTVLFDNAEGNVKSLPAVPCVLAKLRGTYRWHIVIKADTSVDISTLLLAYFRNKKPSKQVSVAIDIDPYSLL